MQHNSMDRSLEPAGPTGDRGRNPPAEAPASARPHAQGGEGPRRQHPGRSGSKALNAAVVGLIFFLVAYCLCFWFGVMPKYYPLLGEVHIVPPAGKHIAVKFVGSALVGLLAGLAGFLAGRRLPDKSFPVLSLVLWLTMTGACGYLILREGLEYIWK